MNISKTDRDVLITQLKSSIKEITEKTENYYKNLPKMSPEEIIGNMTPEINSLRLTFLKEQIGTSLLVAFGAGALAGVVTLFLTQKQLKIFAIVPVVVVFIVVFISSFLFSTLGSIAVVGADLMIDLNNWMKNRKGESSTYCMDSYANMQNYIKTSLKQIKSEGQKDKQSPIQPV